MYYLTISLSISSEIWEMRILFLKQCFSKGGPETPWIRIHTHEYSYPYLLITIYLHLNHTYSPLASFFWTVHVHVVSLRFIYLMKSHELPCNMKSHVTTQFTWVVTNNLRNCRSPEQESYSVVFWLPPYSTKINLAKLSGCTYAGWESISLVAQTVKNLPAMQDTWIWSLGQEDALEKGMATHSSVLAWRIPWTEGPGGLQFMRSQRVGHDWNDLSRINWGTRNLAYLLIIT